MRAARVLVPVTLAAFVVTLPGVAHAAATVSATNMPSGVSYFGGDCDGNTTTHAADYVHVKGPGTPPLGAGSLRITFTKASSGDLFKGVGPTSTATINDVTAASFSSYTPAGSGAGAWMYAAGLNTSTNVETLAQVQAPTSAAWTSTDLLTAPVITWSSFDGSTGDPKPPSGSGTWADFKSLVGTDLLDETDVWTDTCSGTATGTIYLDNVTMGTGAQNPIDFEASPTPALTIKVSKTTVVYGSPVTVSTKMTTGGKAVGGKHVLLMARKAGGASFVKVADVVTSSTGVAASKQTPKKNTVYKWVFNGTHTLAPAQSGTKSVKVARKLTLSIADTTLTAAQKLKASGRETPAAAGSLVTVYRHSSAGTSKIGTATVRSDGTWSLSKDVPKGAYYVYVT